MRLLIIASNDAHPYLEEEVRKNLHQRVDYIALARLMGGDYADYSAASGPGSAKLRRLEERLRIDLRLALRCARLIAEKGYDLVLSTSERVGIPLTWFVGRHVKHVVTLHHPLSPKKIALLRTLKLHCSWAHSVFISRAEAEAFCRALNADLRRTSVLHTPVDTAFFDPAKLPDVVPRNYIHSVGASHRDYATLIRAIRQLPHIPCDFRVGSAWVDNPADYENEPIPPNVQIQPFVHPSELRRYFVESRFTVIPIQPSTQWSAGCTSAQIAQTMRCAVIATYRPGLAEYIVHGETGILVQPCDPQEMKEAIETLWKDPARAKAIGRRAREWMIERFSFEQWLECMAGILTRVQAAIS